MSAAISRGELLLSRRRYDAAEAEFRKALAETPEDPYVLSMLAMCISEQDRHDEALEVAHDAVGQGPDMPFAHYALAVVHLQRDELLKAKAAIDEALRLDPENPDCWALLAGIHLQRSEYTEGLAAANHGLESDPEHNVCQNTKVLALTQLGRREEANAAIQGQLQRDPDNAVTHANQGWSYLHANQPKKAAEHFREALRIDPELEFAQAGMLNALRARNPIFRLLLAYFLWMSRLSSRARWGVIIGGYVGIRVVQAIGKEYPSTWFWTMPLGIIYLLFVFLTWTGPAFTNLLLRLDKYGRYLLSDDEIRASNLVGGSFALAIILGIVALVTQLTPFGLAAGMFLLLIIPLAGDIQHAQESRPQTAIDLHHGPAHLRPDRGNRIICGRQDQRPLQLALSSGDVCFRMGLPTRFTCASPARRSAAVDSHYRLAVNHTTGCSTFCPNVFSKSIRSSPPRREHVHSSARCAACPSPNRPCRRPVCRHM